MKQRRMKKYIQKPQHGVDNGSAIDEQIAGASEILNCHRRDLRTTADVKRSKRSASEREFVDGIACDLDRVGEVDVHEIRATRRDRHHGVIINIRTPRENKALEVRVAQ